MNILKQTVPLYRNSNNNRETFSGNEPSTVVKINRPIVAGHNNNMTLQTDDQRDRLVALSMCRLFVNHEP